ncbi:MAG: hypothetical protein ABSF69_10950 [Polyangiaceae bacterium]|jgi:hypothetical protein
MGWMGAAAWCFGAGLFVGACGGSPRNGADRSGGEPQAGLDGGSNGGSSTESPSSASGSASKGGVPEASVPVGSEGGSAAGPTIAGCSIFPADNAWNTRIDDASAYPVHPNSATYIAAIGLNTHIHADWGDWSTDHYGIPWQTVLATQAAVPMTFQYADQSDPGPYPFPPTALVEGGSGSGGDMHVLVLDVGTCTLYETWSSTYVGPGWSCGSGAKFMLDSDALRPDGWTSADAAGLAVLPGLVRLSEVEAGSIEHAMRFTVATSQQGYIHPATHAAGSSDTSLPPMGLRVRLKASFDLSSFSGPALVILTAMKQYGLMVADNGSDWYITGDSNDGWSPRMDAISSAFAQVFGSDFEAVYTGAISTAGL